MTVEQLKQTPEQERKEGKEQKGKPDRFLYGRRQLLKYCRSDRACDIPFDLRVGILI